MRRYLRTEGQRDKQTDMMTLRCAALNLNIQVTADLGKHRGVREGCINIIFVTCIARKNKPSAAKINKKSANMKYHTIVENF